MVCHTNHHLHFVWLLLPPAPFHTAESLLLRDCRVELCDDALDFGIGLEWDDHDLCYYAGHSGAGSSIVVVLVCEYQVCRRCGASI